MSYSDSGNYCPPAACITPVNCCDTAAASPGSSGDSAATTDQSTTSAATDTVPPTSGESTASWTADDEKRFVDISKHYSPDLKKQLLEMLKGLNRSERDGELSHYEKMQQGETDKARQEPDTKGKSTSQKADSPGGTSASQTYVFVLLPVNAPATKVRPTAVTAISRALSR